MPEGVVVAEARSPGDWQAGLLPPEARLVEGASEKRQRDFTAGRNCAHRALASLGFPTCPILSGPNREPLWPPGVGGSITHSHGYCAAAAGWLDRTGSLGIDVELHQALPAGVAEMVLTETERRWMRSVATGSLEWGIVLFSAKESVYKAWFPLTHRWLGFQAAELVVDPATNSFRAELVEGAPEVLPAGVAIRGRFAANGRYVATSATIA